MYNDLLCFGATVPGKKHLKSLTNNQDSYHIVRTDTYIIGIVTDGCTTSKGHSHNDVGASLFATILTDKIAKRLADHEESCLEKRFWDLVTQDVLGNMSTIAEMLPGKKSEVIKDWLLFTVVGFLIYKETLVVFQCGDGMYVLNDITHILKPTTSEAQPYLGYQLASVDQNQLLPFCTLQIAEQLPLSGLQNLLIGSDGIADILALQDKIIPMTQTPAGTLADFWKDARILENPVIAQNKLTAMNRKSFRVDYEKRDITHYHELMEDDTTFIVLTHSLTKKIPSS